MRPTSPDPRPEPTGEAGPTQRLRRSRLALAATLLGTTGLAGTSVACPVAIPDETAAVSIDLAPGVAHDFTVDVFERRNEEGELVGRACYANLMVPLSAFPSVSNRLDTAAVARTIQESAAALGVEACEVTIYYEDPKEELTLRERCVDATFGFSDDDFWTTESESSCFTAEEIAQYEEWEREWERAQAAEADAYAAAEDGVADVEVVEEVAEGEWGEATDDDAVQAVSDEVVGADTPDASTDLFLADN